MERKRVTRCASAVVFYPQNLDRGVEVIGIAKYGNFTCLHRADTGREIIDRCVADLFELCGATRDRNPMN